MTPWEGSRNDPVAKELVALIPFLEALAIKRVPDVRQVIKYYDGRHIPSAYAEAEAETKRKVVEEWERSKEKTSGIVAGILSAALGSLVKVRFVLSVGVFLSRRECSRWTLARTASESRHTPGHGDGGEAQDLPAHVPRGAEVLEGQRGDHQEADGRGPGKAAQGVRPGTFGSLVAPTLIRFRYNRMKNSLVGMFGLKPPEQA